MPLDVKASTPSTPVCCLILTCRGTRWTWNSGLAAYIVTASRTPLKFTILYLSDTIEGSIFLLLDQKLTEIARALGKVDEKGQIAEDLRTQILGQASMQVNYAQLYSEGH